MGTTEKADDVICVKCVVRGAALLHINPSCAVVNLSDLTVTRALVAERAVMSPINKWVATLARDVTHSRAAVLSPLMTINVNRTISAHPLKCLTVDGLLVDRSSILIRRLIQTQRGRLSFSLSESLIFLLFPLFSLYSLSIGQGPKKLRRRIDIFAVLSGRNNRKIKLLAFLIC